VKSFTHHSYFPLRQSKYHPLLQSSATFGLDTNLVARCLKIPYEHYSELVLTTKAVMSYLSSVILENCAASSSTDTMRLAFAIVII